jgi:sideroflexin-5
MLVPFAAVSTAGIINVAIMRGNEMIDGIDLYEPSGDNLIGKSAVAGQHAVARAAVSRTTVTAACLTVPPVVMGLLKRTKFMSARPSLHAPVQLGVIAATLLTAVPAGIALFPQRFFIDATDLEPKFHTLRDRNGEPIERVYFNRGL